MYIRLKIQRFIIIRHMPEKNDDSLGLPKQYTTEEARKINARMIRRAPDQRYQKYLEKMTLQEQKKQDEKDRRAVNLMVYFLHLTNYCAWIFPEPPPPEVPAPSPRSDHCPDDDEEEDSDEEEDGTTWFDHIGSKWTYQGPEGGTEENDPDFWIFSGDYTRDKGVECLEGYEPEWFKKKCKEEPDFFTKSDVAQIQRLAEHNAVKNLLRL